MTLLLALPALLWSGPAAAAVRPAVWVPPIRADAGPALDQALRRAASLATPAGWPWRTGQPRPGACDGGCRVIRISGRQHPSPSFTLRRVDLPVGRGASTTLALPRGTPVARVAEALMVKCAFLLDDISPPRRPWRQPLMQTRASPGARLPAPPVLRRHSLGLGPLLMVGLDRAYLTFGVEAGGTFSLYGPLALRASVGFTGMGSGGGPLGEVEYDAMPINLLLGAWWTGPRWSAGAFGGLAVTALWLELDNDSLERTSEVALGLGLEGRAAVRVYRALSASLALRGSFLPAEVEVTVDDKRLFEMPRATLSMTVDLSLTF